MDKIILRKFEKKDTEAARLIWNTVVDDADAFPQFDGLKNEEAYEFFSAQTYTGVAELDKEVAGIYILHPNNIGRCAKIANASYAVKKDIRGLHIGEKLVSDSLIKGHQFGFHVLQFNAVVKSNIHAIHLYERLGFEHLGTIPQCYEKKDGSFEDLLLFYHTL